MSLEKNTGEIVVYENKARALLEEYVPRVAPILETALWENKKLDPEKLRSYLASPIDVRFFPTLQPLLLQNSTVLRLFHVNDYVAKKNNAPNEIAQFEMELKIGKADPLDEITKPEDITGEIFYLKRDYLGDAHPILIQYEVQLARTMLCLFHLYHPKVGVHRLMEMARGNFAFNIANVLAWNGYNPKSDSVFRKLIPFLDYEQNKRIQYLYAAHKESKKNASVTRNENGLVKLLLDKFLDKMTPEVQTRFKRESDRRLAQFYQAVAREDDLEGLFDSIINTDNFPKIE